MVLSFGILPVIRIEHLSGTKAKDMEMKKKSPKYPKE
jgi:hypothetical protein